MSSADSVNCVISDNKVKVARNAPWPIKVKSVARTSLILIREKASLTVLLNLTIAVFITCCVALIFALT